MGEFKNVVDSQGRHGPFFDIRHHFLFIDEISSPFSLGLEERSKGYRIYRLFYKIAVQRCPHLLVMGPRRTGLLTPEFLVEGVETVFGCGKVMDRSVCEVEPRTKKLLRQNKKN